MIENEIASGINASATTNPASSSTFNVGASKRTRPRSAGAIVGEEVKSVLSLVPPRRSRRGGSCAPQGRGARWRRGFSRPQPNSNVTEGLTTCEGRYSRPVSGTPATLLIGDICERVGLSMRTVRYYEEQQLVVPDGRSGGGYRLYSQAQVDRLLAIKQMKPLGFSLDQMRELLDARDILADPAASREARDAARQTLGALATFTRERLTKLRSAIDAGEKLEAELSGLGRRLR